MSPAFVLSLYGDDFSVDDFCGTLPRIARLGFSAYQPAVFHATALPEWVREAHRVQRAAETVGLAPSQFVAHFMLEWFANPERLHPSGAWTSCGPSSRSSRPFPRVGCSRFRSGSFSLTGTPRGKRGANSGALLRRRFPIPGDGLGGGGAGLKLAFELMPSSVIGGIRRFVDLCHEIGSPHLGLNFETGHAWSCREMVPLLPFELEARIFGTHLGDNRSTDNVKMPLAHGTVPWGPLLQNLQAVGSQDSLEIEIGCAADQVERLYRQSLEYLRSLDTARKGAPSD